MQCGRDWYVSQENKQHGKGNRDMSKSGIIIKRGQESKACGADGLVTIPLRGIPKAQSRCNYSKSPSL